MEISDSLSNFLSFLCLGGALFACGKAVEAFLRCTAELQERLTIVHRHAEKVGQHWNIKVYYRHGVGFERIIGEDKRVISTRPFRWERTKYGEIRETEQ